MKKADSLNGYLVAPIVSYEFKNKRVTKHLTPEPEHFLNLISQYTKQKFDSGEKILQYGINIIGEQGGTHIFQFNLVKNKVEKNGPEFSELGNSLGDIVLNPQFHPDFTG